MVFPSILLINSLNQIVMQATVGAMGSQTDNVLRLVEQQEIAFIRSGSPTYSAV